MAVVLEGGVPSTLAGWQWANNSLWCYLHVTETSITDHYDLLRPFPCGTPCVTGAVESQKEDTVLKRKLLWQNLKIGSWNVRTLRQTGKLKELPALYVWHIFLNCYIFWGHVAAK